MSPAPKGKLYWIGWIISAVPIFMLLMGAVTSFRQPPEMMENFKKYAYPNGILVPLGIVELVCVVLYVIPRTSILGAILMTGFLGGATATHVRVSEPQWCVPVVVGVLVWLGLVLRDPELRKLLPIRR